jgi:hypothetical protein
MTPIKEYGRRKEGTMIFQTMRDYWNVTLERSMRLTNIATEMNRSAIWTPDQDIAEEENRQADQDLMVQSLRLA